MAVTAYLGSTKANGSLNQVQSNNRQVLYFGSITVRGNLFRVREGGVVRFV
jgi:hypothetical protein